MKGNMVNGEDLLVTSIFIVVKPHSEFQRDGYTLIKHLEINFVQAALGADIVVPLLGVNHNLHIPELNLVPSLL